jgi:response regulator NasT
VVLAGTEPEFLHDLAGAFTALGHPVVGQARTVPELAALIEALRPGLLVALVGMPDWPPEALAEAGQHLAVVAVGTARTADELSPLLALPIHAYLLQPASCAQIAAASAIALKLFQEQEALRADNARLQTALANRKIIERAKGVLMRNNRWSEPEAFRRLQRGAMNRRVPMVELARQILEGLDVEL